MSRLALLGAVCLSFAVGCGDHQPAASEPAPALAPTTTYVLPSLSGGTLDIDEAHLELAAAHAYFVTWPGPGIEPLLFLDRVELIADAADDHGCVREPPAEAGTSRDSVRVVLRGHGAEPLAWDTDHALGEDVALCVARRSAPEDCAAFVPTRRGAVLSVSRERVRGFVHVRGETGDLRARFHADVCPL